MTTPKHARRSATRVATRRAGAATKTTSPVARQLEEAPPHHTRHWGRAVKGAYTASGVAECLGGRTRGKHATPTGGAPEPGPGSPDRLADVASGEAATELAGTAGWCEKWCGNGVQCTAERRAHLDHIRHHPMGICHGDAPAPIHRHASAPTAPRESDSIAACIGSVTL